MKQTNNAIKFLMAQYRAIFQNAYFKGLATAAVVTMGLAAGQAQAVKGGDDAFTGAEEIPAGQTLIITGKTVTDPTTNVNQYKSFTIKANPTGSFSGDISIQGGDAATTGNYVSGSAPTTFTAKTLTVSGDAATNGLLVQGSANAAATVTFKDKIDVQLGKVILAGASSDSGDGILQSKEIIVKSTDKKGSVIELSGSKTQLGYSLEGKGADGETSETKSLSDYTTLTLGTSGSLITTASANTTGAVVDAAVLDISGGAITVNKDSSASDLTLNIVKGDLNAGTITTVDGGTLTISFASGDFVDDKNTPVEKKLTLTSGTLSLGSDITLSGEGQLVVANSGSKLTASSKGVSLTNGAFYAPEDVENAKTVAGNLPIKIGEKGVLDFGSTVADLDQLTFASEASKDDSTIGLDAAGIIKGDTLSLTKELGAEGIVSGKTVNLGKNVSDEVAFATSTFKVGSNLNVGTKTKAKTIVLTAGDVAAINKAHKDVQVEATKNALIKADALAQTGSFGTVEGVTEGTLTIGGDGSKLDVVNGTWTNNNVHVVLGDRNAATLTVGKEDATYKTAAKLVFDNGSKLEITKGTVTVGNDSHDTVLGAELDISALEGENLVFTSGSFTAASGGTIVINQDFIDKLVDTDNTNRKALISSGGIFEVVEGLEINADKLHSGSATANKLAFNGAEGELATLKSDSVTINKAIIRHNINIDVSCDIF